MIDKNNFICKNGRRHYAATCNTCARDRGYKTPDQANKSCYKCSTKIGGKASQLSRGHGNQKCSILDCTLPYKAKGFCAKHYARKNYKRKEPEQAICSGCSTTIMRINPLHKFCSDNCFKINYRLNNKKVLSQNNVKRRKTDRDYHITCNLRSRLSKAISRKQKSCSAVKDLGCSLIEFRAYIERLFLPGMSWDNYGKEWHIDHIVPLDSFNLLDEGQLKQACHYTNLQPLWWRDNIKKGNRNG